MDADFHRTRRLPPYVFAVVNKLKAEAGVAAAPGIGFGEYGDEHVRFALVENEQRIRQATRAIKAALR